MPNQENPSSAKGWGYLVVWEFHVRPAQRNRFEQVYGPAGDWVRFFAQDSSYLGSELTRDLKTPGRYLTLDFWISEQAYRTFRERHQAEYQAIDKRCEEMTERETALGEFARIILAAERPVPDE